MNFTASHLRAGYLEGNFSPRDTVRTVYLRIKEQDDPAVWITLRSEEEVLAEAGKLSQKDASALPLFGIPFAIKDNIDAAGLPTTAGCPEFAYHPKTNAPVVQKLLDAGALLIGKTNLDQFATGLVGVRSPHGVPRNPFHPETIPGGSSSGSAVAVARGFATFTLGTDTAGSGRVPAALNNLVGLKPTRGMLSTRGVVPACRSLDCVSVFALDCADASAVLEVAAGYDPLDAYSRDHTLSDWPRPGHRPVLGIPPSNQLEFFGNTDAQRLFEGAVETLRPHAASVVEFDFSPMLEAALLLYEGPWVAERYAAVGAFLEKHPDAFPPVTKKIISSGATRTAVETFAAMHRLAEFKRAADTAWKKSGATMLCTPTIGTPYTLAEVIAEPVKLNSNLGYYTNFMNLLDYSGLALPAGFLPSGIPWGITLIGHKFGERALLAFGGEVQALLSPTLGASAEPVSQKILGKHTSGIRLAVCGAHMRGLPLNSQLMEADATFIRETRTAAEYRLFALPDTSPPKPGLLHAPGLGANAICVEIWELSSAAFGDFVAAVPAPLGIGKIRLEDGSSVPGFLCEASATRNAKDITPHQSWRTYLEHCGGQHF